MSAVPFFAPRSRSGRPRSLGGATKWAAAAVALLAAGCSEPDPGQSITQPATPDQLARYGLRTEVNHTAHYRITVVGASRQSRGDLTDLADEIGRWMEDALQRYVGLVGLDPGEHPPMSIYAHLIRSVYDYEAKRFGFPAQVTTGFCTVAGEIQLFYKPAGSLDPAATLLHEGFHQYCQRTLFYPTPAEVYSAIPGYQRQQLPTVPLWLAEGVAMIFETGRLRRDADRPVGAYFDLDGYNRPRLDQLQEMLRRDRCPPLADVLSLQMGDTLTTDTYAAMWGLCYDLMRAGRNPRVVGELLRQARNGWGLNLDAVVRDCLRRARTPQEFDRAWNRALTAAAAEELRRLVTASGTSFGEWETGWRFRMQQIR